MAQCRPLLAASAVVMLMVCTIFAVPTHATSARTSHLRSAHVANGEPDTSTGPVSFTLLSRGGPGTSAKHGSVFGHNFGLSPVRSSFQDAQPTRALEVSSRQMQALRSGLSSGSLQKLRSRVSSSMSFSGVGVVDSDSSSEGPPLAVISLRDLYRTEYAGLLGVGTSAGKPEASLRVIFDTGSSDLWVASDLCHTGACAANDRPKYNHTHSETFRSPAAAQDLTTLYGSGELHGVLGVDDVHLGSLVVRSQQIGLISDEVGRVFSQLPFDGIAGLGFPSIADTTSTPFFDNLVAQGVLPRREFAFYLHRNPDRGGAVLWGGTDPRLYNGTLVWFPVAEESYWTLDLLSFAVGEHRFEFEHGHVPQVIIDSGTTFFTAQGDVYRFISRHVPMFRASCSFSRDLPSLTYTLRDMDGFPRDITVPPEEYMVESDPDSNECLPGIVNIPSPTERPTMMLGEVFLRHYFAVFRRPGAGQDSRVGLARARFDEVAEAVFAEVP